MSFTHLLIYFLPPILYYFIYLHIFFQPIPVERKSKTLYPLTPKQFSVFPVFKYFEDVIPFLLASMISESKSMVIWVIVPPSFKILSLSLAFSSLIMICVGMAFLWVYPVWCLLSFLNLNKFGSFQPFYFANFLLPQCLSLFLLRLQ